MREGKRTMVVSVRLTEDVGAELERLAKADRRKVGQYLALLIEDHIAEKRRGEAGEKPETKGKARKA